VALNSFKKASIHVDGPGMYTTIQDAGRVGYQQYGMPVAGPMDSESYLLGQALVGNKEPLGALECTVLPPTLTVQGTCIVAFTGADMHPTINNIVVPRYIPFICHEGDIISGGFSQCGVRMYIAFSGGIDVPAINGSVSTHTKAKIGGFEGRPLQAGDQFGIKAFIRDEVNVCNFYGGHNLFNTALYNRGGRECHEPLRVVLGEQATYFTKNGIKTFGSKIYTLTVQCDRMGFRLDGPVIEHIDGADIISDGAVFGSIQVPSDGNPIVLMADRQTTGGYTKIGTVITADLPRLSQLPIGDGIHFDIVSVEEAQAIYRTYMKRLHKRIQLAHEQSVYAFNVT
jgi:biotin-dependent carboxylase uncharacterized domain protein